ncbi:MAG: elongation factor P [Candidatus Komeilibacteria bacterium]|nr:elongation factor P [Candidatus Komeilibacteria bacterium]
MLAMNELKLGRVIDIDGQPYQIIFTQHIKVARGGATLRTKLKNLLTGQVLEKSFSGSDKVEEADMNRQKANYLYNDGQQFYFMNNESFDQFSLSQDELGFSRDFLKEGITVDTLYYNNKPVSIKLPTKVELEVTEAPPGIKGDTAGSASKLATLETGAEIKVPLFVNAGDIIRVNTETAEYVERV